MQKFKVTKEELYKVLTDAHTFMWDEVPGIVQLEGELLEGGGTVEKLGHKCTDGIACNCPTVEKCCEVCRGGPKLCMDCSCHHKKETTMWTSPVGGIGDEDFNRETPKEKFPVYKHPLEGSDFLKGNSKEEVQLPNRLEYKSDTDIQIKMLADTVNQLRDHLASKENK